MASSSSITPWCDRVSARDKTYCAPSLFVVGIGKCGTNSLSEHLALHPRILRTFRELAWDPRETPPAKLIKDAGSRVSLRVGADDLEKKPPMVWIAKHPKYGFQRAVGELATRLRQSYPHAKVAIALCDPIALPWRRFLFLLTSAVTLHGGGAGEAATIKALASALHSPRLNSSAIDLFQAAFSSTCIRTPRAKSLLDSLEAMGFSTLYNNSWLSSGLLGEAKCRQERTLATAMAEQIQDWAHALQALDQPSRGLFGGSYGQRRGTSGAMNRSLAVVFMEGWARDGAEYVTALLQMLSLPTNEYPWHKAAEAFRKPVYANANVKLLLTSEELDQTKSVAGRESIQHSWLVGDGGRANAAVEVLVRQARQCEALERVTGMRPPWCR